CEVASEKKKESSSTYGLSSVTVPPGGWKVHAVAIYTRHPRQPKEWLKVSRARFNVIQKKEAVPLKQDDPPRGQEVDVTVREVRKDVCEVRATDLRLTLESGECWIGLTPICAEANGDPGHHLAVHGVRNARSEDVFWNRKGGDDPEHHKWTANGAD